MRKNLTIVITIILSGFNLVNRVYAAEESPINQFLGSPLLILAVIIAIDIIAFLYRRIRK
jgi:hypothetical protein